MKKGYDGNLGERGDGNYLDYGGSYKDGLVCKNSMSCTIKTSIFKKNKHILMQRSLTEKQNRILIFSAHTKIVL